MFLQASTAHPLYIQLKHQEAKLFALI